MQINTEENQIEGWVSKFLSIKNSYYQVLTGKGRWVPDSTPYWGLLNETGLWPLEDLINYRKLMLYQNLVKSDDDRLSKNVIMNEEKYAIEKTWYCELKSMAENYKINIGDVKKLQKSEWKKTVKYQIRTAVKTKSEDAKMKMTKLRHQKNQAFERQEYICNTSISRVTDLIRLKLEMLDIGKNKLCINSSNKKENY